ncbi:MAG TPA: hypothetical protein VFT81_01040 [Dermatophilaceae bacterium]|nr:hypothetical protein [Dermatophilaceae bacterium]
MSIAELVAGYRRGAAGERCVQFYPAAEDLARRVPDATAAVPIAEAPTGEGSTGESTHEGTAGEQPGGQGEGRVLLEFVPAGDEASCVERRAGSLGPHDVLVLAMRVRPEGLPVGPLVQAVCASGLRVVRAEGVRHAQGAQTVLVLTSDRDEPQRSYLLGQDLPESEATRLRQANEWAVEGLQLRALVSRREAALGTASAEADALRAERGRLEADRRQLEKQVQSLTRANRLLRAEVDRRPARRLRKAARMLREDPVDGARRLARAAADRARR